jgi:glycosyltransferase involved in cell wall biosynthesis
VLIGDGPLRQDIVDEIKAHELEDRITLTGWIPPEAVLDWYARSDIMFMPSLSEGLPWSGSRRWQWDWRWC